jgi:hypothetical protein
MSMALLFACGSVLLLQATIVSAKPSFVVKPPPSWIRTDLPDFTHQSSVGSATGSSRVLLDETQIRVSDKAAERYYHYGRSIETTAGLEDLSQLKFYFEPSYQQLSIHFIRIHRGNVTIDALKPSEVKTIQQEEELDEQLYNGTFAALVFLSDLRVGDIVEYAYTISGENPVLGGRFADTVYLCNNEPTERLNVRLLWPSTRQINLRNHNTELQPVVRTIGEETEYLWERANVPAVQAEDSTPGWVELFPAVDVSEFKSWEEVVQWAIPLFKVDGANPPDLTAKIEKWRSELQTPEQRLIAALRFVQDEVRYLGIEIGRYSHQPNPPAKVFARRFGDCKDKSLLLSSILNSLGIEAAPALANTKAGQSLDQWQPSPFAFNHAIVQAKIGSRSYWLDATITAQRGSLDKYYDPPYARALVLREGSKALEVIPRPAANSAATEVHDIYKISDFAPSSYFVTTTYRGADADEMRYRISSQSPAEFGKWNLNYYSHSIPSIRPDGLPLVKDDEASDTIVVTEKYTIDNVWTNGKHYFVADRIYNELGKPAVSQRLLPLAIPFPRSITQTTEIELPGSYDVELGSETISDGIIHFSYRLDREGDKVRLECAFSTSDDHVTPAQLRQHVEAIDRIRNVVGFELQQGTANHASPSCRVALVVTTIVIVVGLIALFIFLGLRSRAKKRTLTRFKQQSIPKLGNAPETAIRVKTPEEMTAFLVGFKCGCGKRPYQPESPPVQERFSYDDQPLIGVRLKCNDCGLFTDLYFHQAAQNAEPVV